MGQRPASRMEALLDELCIKYGWCLNPDDRAALLANKARKRDEIADAIIRAEYGETQATDPQTRAWLATLIDEWLFASDGRGASSGLPR